MALAAGSVLAAGLAVEVALRTFTAPEAGAGTEYLNLRESLTVRQHPLHLNDRSGYPYTLFYRYRPGAEWGTRYPSNPRGTFFPGNLMTYLMNAQGFRGRDFVLAKRPGQVRVVTLGDSFTLGEGVRVEQTYASLLERFLQREHPGAEVYNLGVNGYCTEDELVLLRDTAMAYRPDLVVLGYVMNDADHKAEDLFLAETVPAEHRKWKPFLESRWRLVSFVAGRFWTRRLSSMTIRHTAALFENPTAWEDHKRLLSSLRETASRGGAHFLVVIFPDLQALSAKHYPYDGIHGQLGAFFAGAGIPYLDLRHVYRRAGPERLLVHPVDAHPNEEGHRLAAEAIKAVIDERRLLP